MRSLGRTLVLGTTLLTSAVFVTAGVVLYLLVRMSLLSELDRSLVDRTGLLASTIEIEEGKLDLELVDLDMRTFQGRRPEAYVEVRSADGTFLYKSPSLGGADLNVEQRSGDTAEYSDIELPDGRRARAVCLAFSPRDETIERRGEEPLEVNEAEAASDMGNVGRLSIILAQSTSHIDAALARLRILLTLVGGVGAVVAIVALWCHVARSLRPLKELANEIGRVGEDDLSEPIGAGNYPSEIGPVVERLNQLLRRLDAAFRRERTMNANVAHELRNPLTGLQLKLDVALSRDREAREYRGTLDQCRVITSQLQQMVDNLLSLTRLDAGQIELRPELVRLGEFIQTRWNPLAVEAERRRLHVQWSTDAELQVIADASLLDVAVRNLLENAVAHADEGGTVSVRACSVDDGVKISVINTGSHLTQEDAENAMAPFWQHDPSRSRTGVHCGLGLSLVKRIVAVLGGQLAVKSSPGGEFEIAVTLPREAPESGFPPSRE